MCIYATARILNTEYYGRERTFAPIWKLQVESNAEKQTERDEGWGGGTAEKTEGEEEGGELSYANRRRSQFREYLANITQNIPGPHPAFVDESPRSLSNSKLRETNI